MRIKAVAGAEGPPPTFERRDFLRGLLSMPLIGADGASRARCDRPARKVAASGRNADAALFRLVRGFSRAERAIATAGREERGAPDAPARERRLELASRLHANFAREVLTTRAATLAGAVAKLEVAAAWFRAELEFAEGEPITHTPEQALVSIADELAALGLSSAAVVLGAADVPPPSAGPV